MCIGVGVSDCACEGAMGVRGGIGTGEMIEDLLFCTAGEMSMSLATGVLYGVAPLGHLKKLVTLWNIFKMAQAGVYNSDAFRVQK